MRMKSGGGLLVGLLVVGLSSPAAARAPFVEILEEALAEIRAVRDAALSEVYTYALETKRDEVLTCDSTGPLIAHAAATPKAIGGATGALWATPPGAPGATPYVVDGARTHTFGAGLGESLTLEVRGEIIAHVTVRTTEGAGPPCTVE